MARLRDTLVAALALFGLASAPAARPFTVDDALHEESFGQVAVDPSGRWLVIERRDPYDQGDRYDLDAQVTTALTRLRVVDLQHPAPARPLIAAGDPRGVVIAGFSPSGTRLAVYRLAGAQWRLGVITLATGQARWFPVTPQSPGFGRALQWRDDQRLLVIDRAEGPPSWPLAMGHASADRLPALWAARASGGRAVTAVGSGAFRDLRPKALDRRLVELDATTGELRTLTAGPLEDLELSPDGRHAALRLAGEDIPLEAGRPVHGDWGMATRRQSLAILDLATGALSRPCPGSDLLPHLLAWSPSGNALLVYARAPDTPWSAGRLQRIDLVAGRPTPIGDGLAPLIEGRPEVIRAGWMGEDPIVLARPETGARLDWYRLAQTGPVNLTHALPAAPRALSAVGANRLMAIANGKLWRIDRAGHGVGQAHGVSDARGPRTDVEGRLYFAPPAEGWVLQSAGGRQQLRRLSPDGLASRPLVDWADAPGAVGAVSETAATAVLRATDAFGAEAVRLATVGQPPVRVAEVNAVLREVAPPRVAPIRHAGPDGQPLTSWLFLPPDRAPGSPPPPLVVRAYSGDVNATPPQDDPPPFGLIAGVRVLVGHGYAVLVPSLPKPRGTREPMQGLAERILKVVDRAAADPALDGAFDPQRLAIFGHSYGGYTVMAALSQTDRFRAGIAVSGISDLTARWGAAPAPEAVAAEEDAWMTYSAGSVETLQGGMDAPPWVDPARYQRNSPLLAADRIVTPLMLAHGDQDFLPITQSQAMFSALARQDKDAVFVTYWGEGHIFTSPGNIRDFWRRAFDFLDGAF